MAWRITVTLGDLSLEAVGPTEPAPDSPPPLPVLLGVRWREELLGDGALWPTARAVPTGTLVLLAETAAELEHISSATPVAVRLYADADDTEPAASFYGRASDPALAVHDRGIQASIVVTGYLADLAELTAGDYNYPAEDAATRLERVFDDAGVPLDSFDPSPTQRLWWPDLAARTASTTSVLSYAVDLLAWAVVHSVLMVPIEVHRLSMNELEALVDVDGALVGFGLTSLDREVEARAPGRLVDEGGTWTIAWPDTSDPLGSYVVDANDVEFSATWTRRRDLDMDRVEVVKADQSIRRASLDDPVPITGRIETALTTNTDADDTLAMLLPDARPSTSWQADKFTVHLDRAAPGYFPADVRTLVTLHGLEPRHNPDNSAYWHGVIWSREIVAEADAITVELVLMPGRNIIPGFDGVSDVYSVEFADLAADFPGLTFANIDPDIRWVDLMQVGTD